MLAEIQKVKNFIEMNELKNIEWIVKEIFWYFFITFNNKFNSNINSIIIKSWDKYIIIFFFIFLNHILGSGSGCKANFFLISLLINKPDSFTFWFSSHWLANLK